MKTRVISALKWSVPFLLACFGAYLWIFVSGHHFLGTILCGIAAVTVSFYFLKLLKRSHPKSSKRLTIALIALLLTGGLAYAITLIPIFRAAAGEPNRESTYIIVLGAKVNGQSPSMSLQERIDAAYEYLSAHPQVIAIVSGGQGPDEGISEAQCMFNGLTQMGIDQNRIWMEDQSTSTRENLNFSLQLIEEKTGSRPDSIGLVSSEYHIFRATLVAKECGVQAVGIPAPTSWLSLKLNYYLREVAALWYYLLF